MLRFAVRKRLLVGAVLAVLTSTLLVQSAGAVSAGSRRQPGLRRRRKRRRDVHPRLHRDLQPWDEQRLTGRDVAPVCERDRHGVLRRKRCAADRAQRNARSRPVPPRAGGFSGCGRRAAPYAGHRRRDPDRDGGRGGQGRPGDRPNVARLQRQPGTAVRRRSFDPHRRPGRLRQRELLRGRPAPTLSATISDFRSDGGCVDTDNNASDFAAAMPNARNAASPCPRLLGRRGAVHRRDDTGGRRDGRSARQQRHDHVQRARQRLR